MSSQSCPKCGKTLALVRGRFLECLCGYIFDTFLSRETGIEEEATNVAETQDEADAWLSDPALLAFMENAMAAEGSLKPLLGESDNATQMLLVLISGGSVEIRGLTGAGKNTLADHVLAIFPRDSWVKVNGLTDKALRYLPDNLKILYVTERRGTRTGQPGEESTAEYDIKTGISEGEISVFVTEQDEETKQRVTRIHKVKIQSFVFTTTEVDSPPELENRLNVLNVHDDITQNTIVRDAQLGNAEAAPWELADYSQRQVTASKVLARVMEEAPQAVVIPYAHVLTPILSVESSIVRRNTPKVLDLVRASARLYYRQRMIIEGPDGQRAVLASPEDLGLVLYTGERALAAVLSAIPEKPALALKICKVLDAGKVEITTENIELNAGVDRASLGSRATIRKSVKALADRGILIQTGEDGRKKVYSLEANATPLTIDVAGLLREAWRAYALNPHVARCQSEPVLMSVDALPVVLTSNAPNLTNSLPDRQRATADNMTEAKP